jgi:hypothetical protein
MEVRMWDGGEKQQRLFDERPQQVPELKETVQQEVSCLLVAWMRAMVRQESTELGNHEQDKR